MTGVTNAEYAALIRQLYLCAHNRRCSEMRGETSARQTFADELRKMAGRQ
jgi:hypothetical protein